MFRIPRTVCAALTALALAAGCDAPAAKPQPATGEAKTVKHQAPAKSGDKKSSSATVTVVDGKKYLNGVPYDVWLDDPLTIANNSANVAAPSDPVATTDTGTTKPADMPMPETKPPAAAGNDWAAYIATDQLQEESKRVRNQLKTLLQTPATYTADFEVIKMHGAVTAALAVMVAESGDGVSWKPNAGYIRDYGFEMYASAKGPGKPNYDATNAAYENMQSVFSGSIPAGATEPDASRTPDDVASRYYLMKRMKLAMEALKLEINTEAKLKSQADQALLEVMMLTALSKMVAHESYSSSDEAEYKQFIQLMIDKCLEATQAVKDQEFPKLQDAINILDKTCNDCHQAYRNG